MNSSLDTVRGIYGAFAAGDIPGVLGALSPDIRWTEAAGGPYGGEWAGVSAVPDEFVADGDTVVALGEYSGTYKATGKSFRAPFAHVWKFADGKAVSFQQHTDTAVHLQPLQA